MPRRRWPAVVAAPSPRSPFDLRQSFSLHHASPDCFVVVHVGGGAVLEAQLRAGKCATGLRGTGRRRTRMRPKSPSSSTTAASTSSSRAGRHSDGPHPAPVAPHALRSCPPTPAPCPLSSDKLLTHGPKGRRALLNKVSFALKFRCRSTAAAAPTTEPAVVTMPKFVDEPAGRLALQVPLLRAPAACWCARQTVESTFVHVPGDQPARVGAGLQLSEDPRPGAVALPAPEQAVRGLPRPVPLRYVPPRRTRPGPPPDRVHLVPPCERGRSAALARGRQQRLQHRPLTLGQISPPHPKIIPDQDPLSNRP